MHSAKLSIAIVGLALSCALVQPAAAGALADETPEQFQARMRWWSEARFGMFIHWGPVSLKGTEIGWSRGKQIPTAEYDALHKSFDPVKFNADQWVKIAKDAGMKYIVITSKHHDGFCIFDTKTTDYDIMSTPYGRDVVKQLADACKRHGVRLCFYYSILDWYHPHYTPENMKQGGPGYALPAGEKPDMDKYVAYMKEQLRELLTNYGDIGVIWFDGEWEKPWTEARGRDLYQYLRSLKSDVIINNRVAKARRSEKGMFAGDHDTPEQEIGRFQRERLWESCITICRQWAWKPNDQMKSLGQSLRTLITCAGGDGNLLFNVGPMPDGRIEPRQVDRLREMGAWMKKYGDGIYNTRGGPFKPAKWGASTCRDKDVYLYIYEWPAEGALELPPISRKITAKSTLSGGDAKVIQTDAALIIDLPAGDRDEIATVIKLTLDVRAFDIKPVDVP